MQVSARRYSEEQILEPILFLLWNSLNLRLTTAELIRKLEGTQADPGLLAIPPQDREISTSRGDSRFSQIVRNVKSHNSLARLGLGRYDPNEKRWELTKRGAMYVREQAPVLSEIWQMEPDRQCGELKSRVTLVKRFGQLPWALLSKAEVKSLLSLKG